MKKTNENKIEYKVTVLKAKEVKKGRVAFDMEVNGIKIYNCWYTEYTNKEGKEGTMISFPSYQGNNKQYYNHAWFPISAEVKADIVSQLEKLV